LGAKVNFGIAEDEAGPSGLLDLGEGLDIAVGPDAVLDIDAAN
jgi:hypothetical protein